MSDDIHFLELATAQRPDMEARQWQDVKALHGMKCDELSRTIAIETGQAKEISPGIIRYKIPDTFKSPFGKSEVLGKDLWKHVAQLAYQSGVLPDQRTPEQGMER